MPKLAWFIFGLIVGAPTGYFFCCLMIISKRSDKEARIITAKMGRDK